MSKFTRFIMSLLVAALVFVNMAPVKAVNANPVIDKTLSGVYWDVTEEYGPRDLIYFSAGEGISSTYHLEYRNMQDLIIFNAVNLFNEEGEVETYYFGKDYNVYHMVRNGYSDLEKVNIQPMCIYNQDYAAVPQDYDYRDGYAVAIYETDLYLTDIYYGNEFGHITLPFADYPEAIAAKDLNSLNAEYYIIDTMGRIWEITVSFRNFELVDYELVMETGYFVEYGSDLYYDGTWLYYAYADETGTGIVAIDPVGKTTYDYGVLQQGVFIFGVNEPNVVAGVTPEEPEEPVIIDNFLEGFTNMTNNGQGIQFWANKLGNANIHPSYEYRGDGQNTWKTGLVQLDSDRNVRNYVIGQNNYAYEVDLEDHHEISRRLGYLGSYSGYAPGPLYVQEEGTIVAVKGLNLYSLNMYNGEVYAEFDIDSVGAREVAAKDLNAYYPEYYILDIYGVIWEAILDFDNNELIEINAVYDTGTAFTAKEGFYYDGEYLFRTYLQNGKSRLMAYDVENWTAYDLGQLSVPVWGLYVLDSIPTVTKIWEYQDIVFVKGLNNYTAYGVYFDRFTGEELHIDAQVTKKKTNSMTIAPKYTYTALIPENVSPDHLTHKKEKTVTEFPIIRRDDLKPIVKPIVPDPKPIYDGFIKP